MLDHDILNVLMGEKSRNMVWIIVMVINTMISKQKGMSDGKCPDLNWSPRRQQAFICKSFVAGLYLVFSVFRCSIVTFWLMKGILSSPFSFTFSHSSCGHQSFFNLPLSHICDTKGRSIWHIHVMA